MRDHACDRVRKDALSHTVHSAGKRWGGKEPDSREGEKCYQGNKKQLRDFLVSSILTLWLKQRQVKAAKK